MRLPPDRPRRPPEGDPGVVGPQVDRGDNRRVRAPVPSLNEAPAELLDEVFGERPASHLRRRRQSWTSTPAGGPTLGRDRRPRQAAYRRSVRAARRGGGRYASSCWPRSRSTATPSAYAPSPPIPWASSSQNPGAGSADARRPWRAASRHPGSRLHAAPGDRNPPVRSNAAQVTQVKGSATGWWPPTAACSPSATIYMGSTGNLKLNQQVVGGAARLARVPALRSGPAALGTPARWSLAPGIDTGVSIPGARADVVKCPRRPDRPQSHPPARGPWPGPCRRPRRCAPPRSSGGDGDRRVDDMGRR